MSKCGRTAKLFVLSKSLKGPLRRSNFKIVEEQLSPLKDGGFLSQAAYWRANADPRIFTTSKAGDNVKAVQIAKITESRNANFPVGKYVVGDFGWRTGSISTGDSTADSFPPYLLAEVKDLPLTVALGPLGISGIAAYFGFNEICKPKEGDVVVVSSAASSVGSHVGQLAKLKGCKVIGITSSDEKGNALINELGFDHFINYKSQDIGSKLSEYAAEGVDCYFDNVGGEISSAVIYHLKKFSRICVCGATSLYSNNDQQASEIHSPIKVSHAVMKGMQVSQWQNQWSDAITSNLQLIKEKKLKYKEVLIKGFENLPEVLIGSMNGNYLGSVIVQA